MKYYDLFQSSRIFWAFATGVLHELLDEPLADFFYFD